MFVIERLLARPLTWWHERKDDIDFDADYQRRGDLWKPNEKADLIDSILNGYDIPKMYLADFTRANSPLNERKKMYAIIDGKQRFKAVFEFLDDKVPLNRDFVYEKDPLLALGGCHYSDLVSRYPGVSRVVERYEPEVMGVVSDDQEKIENLFIRLNKTTKGLSGAEVRNAMPGIVPVLTRDVAAHGFFRCRISFDVKRYQDRNAATKLLLVEHSGKLVGVKKTDLDKFARQVKEREGPKTEPYHRTAARVRKVLDEMERIFRNQDHLLKGSGVVPLYYWLVRDYPSECSESLRPFLEELEKRCKRNNQQFKEAPARADTTLLDYSRERRSPNDQGALVRLYRFLDKGLHEFLRPGR